MAISALHPVGHASSSTSMWRMVTWTVRPSNPTAANRMTR